MFAFSLWDRSERTLHLVRDRLGEKPLYYGLAKQTFLFASELKALVEHPDFAPSVDRGALALYLRFGTVPAPNCIYKGLLKLPPGTILSVPERASRLPAPVPYWSLAEAASQGLGRPFLGSPEEATDELERILKDSVKLRMESDVPLGAFLSGGVDSSTIVALMTAQSPKPIQTFTVGFDEPGFDESGHAKAVAAHLHTDHTEIRLRSEEAISVIPRLPSLYDEPFADSSQIPTFLVSQLARKKVIVSLSGDGGDELFGGYNRYFVGRSLWNRIRWLPLRMRRAAARSLRVPSPAQWDRLAAIASPFLTQYGTQGTFGDKFQKIADVLSMSNPDDLYKRLVSNWDQPGEVLAEGAEPDYAVPDVLRTGAISDFTERMMYWDTVTYLPDDILVKLDRASMGVGLESRVPFLDHRVVEFAWRLPLGMKLRRGEGKWILRQVLKRHVPPQLFDRAKMGFGVPVGDWLRGDLRDWAESLLDPQKMREEGYFRPEVIQARWKEHLCGKRNWQNQLWVILMFQAWLHKSRRAEGVAL
jgi:asparagine synthase (glutamine-hydrolysing)